MNKHRGIQDAMLGVGKYGIWKAVSPTMRMREDFAIPIHRTKEEKERHYMAIYGASSPMTIKIDPAKCDKLMKEFDLSKLEGRVMSLSVGYETYLNPCGEIFLSEPKTCNLFEEKPMNLTLSYPVLVGTCNILTAQSFELDAIIREAQLVIENNADLCKLSEHHKAQKVELEEVIKLCVEQLDKDVKKDDVLLATTSSIL